MNIPTLVILAILLVCVAFAVRHVVKQKKSGGCGCGCSGCSGGSCCAPKDTEHKE